MLISRQVTLEALCSGSSNCETKPLGNLKAFQTHRADMH
jgi:hypothetical protein